MKRTILFLALFSIINLQFSSFNRVSAQTRLVGGDLSLVPAYEKAGDVWLDENGVAISDMIQYVKEKGWNAIRIRLFLDPTQDSDPATCQDYNYVQALALRVKAAGMKFLLDFHYSDTWADPSTQKIPSAWMTDTSDKALASHLYDYTLEVVGNLIRQGAAPDYVQIGNEITYGLLWRTSDGRYPQNSSQYVSAGYCPTWGAAYSAGTSQWRRTALFLNNAAHAVRQGFTDNGLDSTSVKIVVHTDMGSAERNSDNFYRHIRTAGFDNYDIVGLSYYPFWHGGLTVLSKLLTTLGKDFPTKEVQIVETAWYNNWYPSDADYTIAQLNSRWMANATGIVNFLTDLVTALEGQSQVTGLYYWMPEECGNGYRQTVMQGWINRGLWTNSSNQRHPLLKATDGTSPISVLARFAGQGNGIGEVKSENAGQARTSSLLSQSTYDLTGRIASRQRGICIRQGRMILRSKN